jgi:NTE family protein
VSQALLPGASAQTGVSAPQQRPKIGLALGGGAARGCAHVGVLKALEEMQVPIDYIAGTSMGAVVGALYASGMSADEIDGTLTTIDWRDAMNDRTRFKDLSFRRKEDESHYLTAFEAGIRNHRIALPRGLHSAQKLRFLMQSYLIPVAGIRDFTKLPIPFKAVAADIETGDAVLLDHGDLAEAIRASMSIPGVFTPVEREGKLLVDGGIADNVPVDVVRAMGADIVIAVDVGSPMLKRDELGSLFSVTSQVLTLLTRRNAQVQLSAADVVIVPPVTGFASMDFTAARPIIDAGRKEAMLHRPRLEPLSVTPSQYAELISLRPGHEDMSRPLDYIVVEGTRHVDHRIIRAHMLTKPGRPLSADLLRHDVTRLYGLDDFEQVNFALQDVEKQHGLVLTLREKPWGPTYLRFGLRVEDDLQGDGSYTVTVNHAHTRINALGAEWRTDVRLGRQTGVITEFYQPLDFRGRFFVAPGLRMSRDKLAVWEEGRRVAQYGVLVNAASLDLGMAFGEWGEWRAGLARARVHATVDTGATDLPSGTVDHGAFRTAMTIIRLDDPYIPHDGGNFIAQFYAARRSLGGDADYSKFNTEGSLFRTFGGRQTAFIGGGFGSSLNTTLPIYDEFVLGGLLSLGGFSLGQLHGQRYAILRSGTYVRVLNLAPDIGDALYVGMLFEVGNAWEPDEPMRLRSAHRSATAVIGAQTIAGPILLGYGRAETGNDHFYLTIGKSF